MADTDLTWVEQVQTIDAIDPAVKALDANPGWRLLHVGTGSGGQTTLTYGWPWADRCQHRTDDDFCFRHEGPCLQAAGCVPERTV